MQKISQPAHFEAMKALAVLGLMLLMPIAQAQKPPKIQDKTFATEIVEDALFLTYKNDRIALAKSRNWFFKHVYAAEEEPVDTTKMLSIQELQNPNGVKAAMLSKNLYLLVLSFYTAPSGARVATGTEILLAFNTKTNEFSPFSPEFIITGLGRGWGPCRNATMNSYLLHDVDNDGQLDIGVLQERITCDFENDAPSRPYYTQEPIKWYLNMSYAGDLVWLPERSYEGILPANYAEITSLPRSPVDVVGHNLWKTNNRLAWPRKLSIDAIVLTNNQKEKAIADAQTLENDSLINVISRHTYVRRVPVRDHY